jgi:predicted ferric reductase
LQKPHRRFALPASALLVCYVFIALLPLALALAQQLPPRPWRDELASALAMVGFAMLFLEFVISGRFQTVSGRVGIDVSMRFHQLVAITLTTFLLVHPWLFTLPLEGGVPGDRSHVSTLGLAGAAIGTGWAAWFGLILLMFWARFRAEFGYRYEVWRACHGFGALAVALLGLHHTLDAGRYSAGAVLAAFWYLLAGVALLAIVHIYLLRPLLQRRHPYRVVAVDPVALRTWQVTVEPVRGPAIQFEPGQFVWLTLDRSPFSITEHPFSISSCPADRPSIAFVIKEVGDFTANIGSLRPGAPAYLDGPHGNMVVSKLAAAGLVLIAGGVGLAPIMSILRQAHADHDPRTARLIYGNREESQIMYRQELEAMRSKLDLQISYVLSEPPAGWTGEVGQLDAPMLDRCLPASERGRWLYVVCGPSAMIDRVEDSLAKLGVPLRQIVSEKFSYD